MDLSANSTLQLKVRAIYDFDRKNRRKTIFLETPDANLICLPWKYLKRETKIQKVLDFIKLKGITDITRDNLSEYRLTEIEYIKKPGFIKNLIFKKK